MCIRDRFGSGRRGLKGAQGDPGPQGAPGAQGAQGAKGDKGDAGASITARVFYLSGQTKRFVDDIDDVTALTLVGSGNAGFSRLVFDSDSKENINSPDFTVTWLTSALAEASNIDQVGTEVIPANHVFGLPEGVYNIFFNGRCDGGSHERMFTALLRVESGRDELQAIDRPYHTTAPTTAALFETDDQLWITTQIMAKGISVPAAGANFLLVYATGNTATRMDGYLHIEKVG